MARPRKDDGLLVATEAGATLGVVPESTRVSLQRLSTRAQLQGDGIPPSLGVTAALRGEGVSFTALGLATVLSEDLDRLTCLVRVNWSDADPEIDHVDEGFVGLVSHRVDVDDVVHATGLPNLRVIGSGQPETRLEPKLSTGHASDLIGGLCARFEHVVLDLPPTSESTVAMSIGGVLDAILLVADEQTTKVEQVERAAADLGHTRLLGVVLNGHAPATPEALRRHLVAGS